MSRPSAPGTAGLSLALALAAAGVWRPTAASPPPAGGRAPAAASVERRRQCAALEEAYQRLEARMRSGYGPRASERLWEQRRRLQQRRWALHC